MSMVRKGANMFERNNKFQSFILAGVLLFSLAGFGCARSPSGIDQNTDQDQEDTNDNYDDIVTPIVTPTPEPNYPDNSYSSLTAVVTQTKTPGVLFWEKVEATIQVSNPSQSAVTGTLNITFTHKTDTVETVQKQVSLGAGQSTQLTVKSTKHADDVTVTVVNDNSSGGSGYDYNYGNSSGYSNYGSSSGYSSGNSYSTY